MPSQDKAELSTNRPQQSDDEPVSLSKSELQELIQQEARKLAPQVKQREDLIEQRTATVTQLRKQWGADKFESLTSDLGEALDGQTLDDGKTFKPAVEEILDSKHAGALIEYLTDPENADEAEAIGRMGERQAARAIARLEVKVQAMKAKDKPQVSSAPAPIESVRGQGNLKKSLFDLPPDEYAKRRREQLSRR